MENSNNVISCEQDIILVNLRIIITKSTKIQLKFIKRLPNYLKLYNFKFGVCSLEINCPVF